MFAPTCSHESRQVATFFWMVTGLGTGVADEPLGHLLAGAIVIYALSSAGFVLASRSGSSGRNSTVMKPSAAMAAPAANAPDSPER